MAPTSTWRQEVVPDAPWPKRSHQTTVFPHAPGSKSYTPACPSHRSSVRMAHRCRGVDAIYVLSTRRRCRSRPRSGIGSKGDGYPVDLLELCSWLLTANPKQLNEPWPAEQAKLACFGGAALCPLALPNVLCVRTRVPAHGALCARWCRAEGAEPLDTLGAASLPCLRGGGDALRLWPPSGPAAWPLPQLESCGPAPPDGGSCHRHRPTCHGESPGIALPEPHPLEGATRRRRGRRLRSASPKGTERSALVRPMSAVRTTSHERNCLFVARELRSRHPEETLHIHLVPPRRPCPQCQANAYSPDGVHLTYPQSRSFLTNPSSIWCDDTFCVHGVSPLFL